MCRAAYKLFSPRSGCLPGCARGKDCPRCARAPGMPAALGVPGGRDGSSLRSPRGTRGCGPGAVPGFRPTPLMRNYPCGWSVESASASSSGSPSGQNAAANVSPPVMPMVFSR